MMRVFLQHRNEGASRPLVVPFRLDCNTPDDQILANVLTNARRYKKWIKQEDAHDHVAVICGSAPSLADHVEPIGVLQEQGAHVFALNAAAGYLHLHGVLADAQIIMDAQPATADLVGPAKAHWLASQCSPETFERAENPLLFHATHGDVLVDEQEGFPEHDDDYALIGSAVTVGVTALALLYTVGYRKFVIFGMDSSHRDGASHAMRQSMNDGDPLATTEFRGKKYVSSFTMKAQAEAFMDRALALEKAGCEIIVRGSGYLPDLWAHRNDKRTEREKYEELWTHSDYRFAAPGVELVGTFLEIAKPRQGDRIIDFGCGTGRAMHELHKRTKCEVVGVDFAANCRDKEAEYLPLVVCDLTQKIPVLGDYGFCTDVMEHIEPDKVDEALRRIVYSGGRVFFQISTVDDAFGGVLGCPLHLTVKPHSWWRDKFVSLGFAVAWEQENDETALFFVTLNHLRNHDS